MRSAAAATDKYCKLKIGSAARRARVLPRSIGNLQFAILNLQSSIDRTVHPPDWRGTLLRRGGELAQALARDLGGRGVGIFLEHALQESPGLLLLLLLAEHARRFHQRRG